MKSGVGRLLACALVVASLCGRTTPCPAAEARGFAQLEGNLGFPSGPAAAGLPGVGGGGYFSFGLGLRGIPALVGIGAGAMVLGGSTKSGPDVAVIGPGGATFSGSTISANLQLRHLDAFVRIEPEWTFIRPFAEASIGVAALWQTTSIDAAGTEIDHWEDQRSAAFAYGFAAGVDLLPWRKSYGNLNWQTQGTGIVCLGFTAGVRSYNVASLDMGSPSLDSSGSGFVLGSATGDLHELEAFVALTFAFEPTQPSATPPPAREEREER